MKRALKFIMQDTDYPRLKKLDIIHLEVLRKEFNKETGFKPDYEVIDSLLRGTKFFSTFEKSIRVKLYYQVKHLKVGKGV
jgi:hypothetical protein